MHAILFVCMGNICRSPALAAVMQKKLDECGRSGEFFIDSAGLSTHYLGFQADRRMRLAAEKKGYAIDHIAKLFEKEDFEKYDAIIAVDENVHHLLLLMADTPALKSKIFYVGDLSQKFAGEPMPDPFYDGEKGFDRTMEMAEDICSVLLSKF